jgi:hypothetical protein
MEAAVIKIMCYGGRLSSSRASALLLRDTEGVSYFPGGLGSLYIFVQHCSYSLGIMLRA